ncbi:hypothetical protein [Methylibium sp. Pch-M]|uniref:hypothetical protein n=1 Tax=Methylibium sp. Pch-M TaxID=2082386 RepID=UPI001011D3FB|nr:hypothetical protein [Methylibium sp. Pch-M]
MKAKLRVDVPHAFVAKGADLGKIWQLFAADGMKLSATVRCKDDIVREFTSLDELLAYENPVRAAMLSIEISARSSDWESSAEVTLGGKYRSPMSLSLGGEEALITKWQSSLADTLDGMRSWYSRIATLDLFYVAMPLFVVLMFSLQVSDAPAAPKSAVTFQRTLYLTVLALGLMALVYFIGSAISRLRARFFPVATFAVGQGIARHAFGEQIRWVVIIGFVISVLASLFVTPILAI